MAKRLRFKVQDIARERGFTIEKLARETGLGRTTVSQIWHNQTQNPGLATLTRIGAVLGVDARELYEEVDN